MSALAFPHLPHDNVLNRQAREQALRQPPATPPPNEKPPRDLEIVEGAEEVTQAKRIMPVKAEQVKAETGTSAAALVVALRPITSRIKSRERYHWCVKPGAAPNCVKKPLTEAVMLAHVSEGASAGLAPITPGESTTLIGLLDFDSHKGETLWPVMQEVATKVRVALIKRGCRPIAFRSSGGKGIHLYLIWDTTQDAFSVRRLLQDALAECGLTDGARGVVNQQVEVFPKQDDVPANGFGNMFVLPLARESVALDDTSFDPLPKAAAIDMAWAVSDPVPVVERPRPAPVVRTNLDPTEAKTRAAEFLKTRDGAVEGEGGNAHTYATAAKVKDYGVEEHEAIDVLAEWNEKKCSPPWEREELETLIRNVYTYGQNPVGSARLDTVAREEFEDLIERLESAKSTGIQLRQIADIVAEMREPEWLLEDILEGRAVAVCAGPRNTFKSFIANGWGYSAALAGHGTVILSGEGAGLDRRTRAWFKVNAPDFDLKTLPLVAYERPLALNSATVVADLVIALKALPWVPKLIVVDTFSKFSPGLDENDNPKVAEFLTRLGMALRDVFGCTLLLVAHSGHSDPGRPRGASALMANPDAEYIVKRETNSMFVTVTRERFKDTPSLPPLTYHAEVVDLGYLDKRGRPVTSLALKESTETLAPLLSRAPTGVNQKLVWEVVQELIDLHKGTARVEEVIATAASRMAKTDGRDTRRQHMRQALQSLQSAAFIAIRDDEIALV